MPKKEKGVRMQPTIRQKLYAEVKAMAEKEGRTESEMAAVLIEVGLRFHKISQGG